MNMRFTGKTLGIVALALVLVLSACGNANEKTGDQATDSSAHGSQPSAGQAEHETPGHGQTQTDEASHGQQTADGHGHNGEGQHGGHSSDGQQSNDHPNKPVSLSEVQGVVASTSLTALIAKAAGAEQVSYIAPSELRHPPEYDYRPSDISKVKDSYLVYLGYEPFMAKLMEAGKISTDMAATVEVDNTPQGYIKATKKLAEIWGTQDEQLKFETALNQLTEEILRLATEKKTADVKVVSQIYMTPLLEWLGYDVVGQFGPDEMTPSQLAELAKLKPDLIVDNLHMPQAAGFSEISKGTKRIELRSYPEQEMKSVLDILSYNAKQLGIMQ